VRNNETSDRFESVVVALDLRLTRIVRSSHDSIISPRRPQFFSLSARHSRRASRKDIYIYIYPGSRSTSRKSIAVATHPSSSSSLQNLPLAYLVADLKATCIKTLDQHRQNDPPAVNRSRLLIYYSFPLLLFLPVLFYHLSHTWIDRIFLVSLLALVLSSPRRLPVLVSFLVLIIDSPRTRLNSGRIRR
jgi:hypothetical protein